MTTANTLVQLQVEQLAFVNYQPAKCGCTFRFSSGGGQYSDVGYVNLCKNHSARTSRIRTNEDRKNRIYIAGPMTGLPDLNFPAFNTCAANFRKQGWHVENPAEHGIQEDAAWSDYLRHDFSLLASCQAIYLLPGWQNSKGALLELHIAQTLGDMLILGDIEDIDATPKPFMYGIQEPDGSAYMEEGCVAPSAEDLQPEVDGINSQQDPEDGLYRLVPLFTRPAPITTQVAALQEAEAALEAAIARLTQDAPDYPVHATSEGKALDIVRNALTGAQQAQKNTAIRNSVLVW